MSPSSTSDHQWALLLATACVLLVGGAACYEHAVVVPVWTTQPPESLAVFHGPYPISPKSWWTVVHGPTLLLMIVSWVLVRGQPRQRTVGIAVVSYGLVLGVTVLWYVPELLALISDPGAPIPPEEWARRADRWEVLSLGRLAAMLGIAVAMLRALGTRAPLER